MVNKVTLIGNLGQTPDVRVLENGTKVARLSVATNENYQDKNGEWQTITEWHKVIVWRWLADRAELKGKKGSLVYISGKLTTRKVEKQGEDTKWYTEVVANEFRVLEKTENGGAMPIVADAPPLSNSANETTDDKEDTPATSGDDDLPF